MTGGSFKFSRALVGRSASVLVHRVAVGVTIGLLASLILASSALAQLPEFNLLGSSGGSTVTQMNMATGQFSGTSEIDGEHFTLTGTESGNKAESVLTLEGGGYESFDTDYYEILPDGNVGGPGSFHDTKGNEESYTGEITTPAATVPSNTSVTCTPSGSTDTCVATVSGSGGVPTGNATFSASDGSFSGEEACVLLAGSCSVTYLPPSGASTDVKAVYSGDGTFRASQDTTEQQEEAATKEKEAKEKKEKESAGKRKSAVAVTCTINVDGSAPSTCTAQVGDGTGGNPIEIPTGSVKFSTTLGSFLGSDACTLSHSTSGNTSFCVVQYAPPPGQSIIGTELPIKAAYSGDVNFNPGEGAFKLAQKGVQAEEFEDERINREACEADENITAEVNEKTFEVTVPYTAPDPGTVQASMEILGSSLGAGLPGPGAGGSLLVFHSPSLALATATDDDNAAPSTPISKDCETKVTLALAGAKKASLRVPLAQLAKKKSKSKPKETTIAKANIKVTHAGPVKLHIHLNKTGKKLLALMKRKHKHAHVTIKLQFKPSRKG